MAGRLPCYDNTAKVWDADRSQERSADGRVDPAGFAAEPWPLPDTAKRKRYHTEQAALAVQQKQWFAAEFHRGRECFETIPRTRQSC
jgi:hypothetical protein